MNIEIIFGPIVGAVIGYITNGIAIKMLFRPLYPKYLFSWKLPFTPGMIPKNKERISASIGKAISENLINPDALAKQLLSKEIIGEIEGGIDGFVEKQSVNEQTLREYLYSLLSKEEIEQILSNTKDEFTEILHKKLANSDIGSKIAGIAVQRAMDRAENASTIFGMVGRGAIALVADALKDLLANKINEIMKDNSKEIVDNLIISEYDRLLDKKMSMLIADNRKKVPEVKSYIINAYKKIVTDSLPRILKTVNISKVVEDKIMEMDLAELETLILQVAGKELKAIIWLGALLGFLMGFVNGVI